MSEQSARVTTLDTPRATEAAGDSRPVFPEATLARARETVTATRAVPVLGSIRARNVTRARLAVPEGCWNAALELAQTHGIRRGGARSGRPADI